MADGSQATPEPDRVDPTSMVRVPRPKEMTLDPGVGVGRSPQPPSPMTQQVSWVLFAGVLLIGALALFAGPREVQTTRVAGVSETAASSAEGNVGESSESPPATNADGTVTTVVGSAQFSIVVGGDVIVHESVADSARTDNGFDFGQQFALVAPAISAADIAVCHLEVPLSATNSDLEYYPAFRVPNQLADGLASAGFDACTTASNHSLDAGPAGVTSTLDQLDRVGLKHTGTARSSTEATAPLLLPTPSGLLVGWLSYSYGFNGTEVPADQAWLANGIDPDRIERDAAAARAAGADFVAVSLHWGTEYQSAPTEQQTTVSTRLLGSTNIDLLVGHHAHVIQPVQKIGDEYAILGLGNFQSNQSPETCSPCPIGVEDGVLLRLVVTQQPDGTIGVESIEPIPTWVNRTGGHQVVDTANPPAGVDPAVAQESAARTLAALGPEVGR